MIRALAVLILIGAFIWAPWMSMLHVQELVETVVSGFGPVPAICYDHSGKETDSGVAIRWYPLGRLVHTCSGDYVAWVWGGVSELGGVHKTANELNMSPISTISCVELLERRTANRATSTPVVLYTGELAKKPDFSIFADTEHVVQTITHALAGGATFAGKYAVATWECGPTCYHHAVIDVETGLVIAYGIATEYGVSYTLDNNLLVTNPLTELPRLPMDDRGVEDTALTVARIPREYYELTHDALANSTYLVRVCVEGSMTGYLSVTENVLQIDTDLVEN